MLNRGDVEACAAVYEVAVESLLRLGQRRLPDEPIAELRSDAENAAAIANARSRAWVFRGAMDQAYRSADRASDATRDAGGLRARR